MIIYCWLDINAGSGEFRVKRGFSSCAREAFMQILGRRLIIFFNPIKPIEMNISLKLFLASLPILFLPVVLQAQLDEQVPYQGDTLLTNPTQFREDGNGHVFMDCDWQTMVSMIRDLEERIAGEVETDTIYGDYRMKELTGDRLYMRYECIVLRDSILSLQIAYDEVLAPRVTLDSAVILSDISAALSASFTGSGVESSGFKWANDSLMTSPQSGIGTGATSPIADTLTVLNPGKLHYFTAYAVKNGEYFYGDTLPLLTMPGITTNAAYEVMDDEGILSSTYAADSIDGQGFVWGQQRDLSDGTSVDADTTDGSTSISYELTGLASGEAYYFSSFASNASGTTFGDTLSLVTRPGITTGSANVLSSKAATVNGTFVADSITAQGFVWGVESDLSDGVDVAADTTAGSTAFDYALSDLAEGVLHHYSAYGTNATGTTRGDTLTFLTMPGITTDEANELSEETATLNATFSADSITAQGFVWGLQSDLSDGTSVSADTTGGSAEIEYALAGLTADATYYFAAYATNASGTTYGDTLSFVAQVASCGDQTSVSYQGHDYNIVSIGTQCWFAENLRNTNYRNGNAIPNVTDNDEWSNLETGAQCSYDNNDSNISTYGRLYNWYAVNDSRDLCPTGWHVPTDAEWTTLTNYLGTDPGDKMKSSEPDWNGSNSSGFSGLPGGQRYISGNFGDAVSYGLWWSSLSNGDAWNRILQFNSVNVPRDLPEWGRGFSVRCVRD